MLTCQFEKHLPQPEIKCTHRIHLGICLVFHSITDLLLETPFWANFYSSYYIILSYLVKNSIQRNVNRRGEKHLLMLGGRNRLCLPKIITREMNKKQWWANNHYFIYKYLENWWKVFIYLENKTFSTLNLQQWFRLPVISHLYWCSNSAVFVDV